MITSRRPLRLGIAAAVAGLVATAVTATASAASGSEPEREQADSYTFAGYGGSLSDTGVQATFSVPSFTCAANEYSGTFPSIQTYYEPGIDRLINGGGGVEAQCTAGVRSYTPVLLGEDFEVIVVDKSVDAGDKIRVTFTSRRPSYVSTIENLTKGWSAKHSSPYSYPTSYGQVGDGYLFVDDFPADPPSFKRTVFSKVTVDGRTLVAGRWVQFDYLGETGDPVLKTSVIKKGEFKVKPV